MASSRSNLVQIGRVLTALKKGHADAEPPAAADTLSHLICVTLADGTTMARARAAFRRLQESFVDWNELRVTPPDEIADVMGGLPAGREKAAAVTAFLNAVFERENILSLEFLKDKAKREARAYLEAVPGVSPAAAAAVVLHCLEGHAIPVDAGVQRVLTRLGLIGADTPVPQVQAALERHVPAKDAIAFANRFRRHADEVCLVGEPKCSECVLASKCPSKVKPAARPKAVVKKVTLKRIKSGTAGGKR